MMRQLQVFDREDKLVGYCKYTTVSDSIFEKIHYTHESYLAGPRNGGPGVFECTNGKVEDFYIEPENFEDSGPLREEHIKAKGCRCCGFLSPETWGGQYMGDDFGYVARDGSKVR